MDKNHSHELVAENDIVVYKFLTSKEIEVNYVKELPKKYVTTGFIESQKNILSLMKDDFSLYTPFYFKKIDEDIIEGKRPLVAEGKDNIDVFDEHDAYCVCGGYIHIYGVKFKLNYSRKYKMFKCVIKKGTRYYDNGKGELAAKEIWFEEEIK